MLQKKRTLFVSHCSSDALIMEHLSSGLNAIFHEKYVKVFNTFQEKTGTDIGTGLSDALRKNIASADLMIAVITDNYLRSIKCISELSSFWFLSRKVLPIVLNGTCGVEFLYALFGQEVIYLDPQALSAAECAVKFCRTIQNNRFPFSLPEESLLPKLTDLFSSLKQERSLRPYIGSTETNTEIVQFCERNGIDSITDRAMDIRGFIDRLKNYHDIFIISTTGANLISGLASSFLENALLSGKNLTLLLPNKYSDFCADVAEIESSTDPEGNLNRLANAFADILTNLQRSVDSAAAKANGASIGKIHIGCAYTLLRQTITLGMNGEQYWGWLSITVPPGRTNDRTTSISFSGSDTQGSFGSSVIHHVLSVCRLAKDRGDYYEFQPGKKDFECFHLERRSAVHYWTEMQTAAMQNMLMQRSAGVGYLIEVAANHPLLEGLYPAEEFASRLDFAVMLYRKYQETATVKIYVPGSRHRFGEHTDSVSLSTAGKAYLIEKGIPEEDILGEAENARWKGKAGVYNSADECFVAANIFRDMGFQRLFCVCSPNQMERKRLFYMAFGVLPDFYTVPGDHLAHNAVYELLQAIPDVLYCDHTWQDPNSPNGLRTRAERIPL